MISGQVETETTYQGRFGEYTITAADRRGVLAYRLALLAVAVSLAVGTLATLTGASPWVATLAYAVFCLALGTSIATIHIYMLSLHRALWALWSIGSMASLGLAWLRPFPLATTAYNEPAGLVAVGLVCAALTGICIKESFCFGWWETVLTAFALPLLLLGHLFGLLSVSIEAGLLGIAALALLSVAVRKFFAPMPDDIGDKTVHAYVRGETHD